MQKLYEIFKILQIQKRKLFAEIRYVKHSYYLHKFKFFLWVNLSIYYFNLKYKI